MKKSWVLATCLMTLPLSSCGLWNNYEKPQTETPDAWTTQVSDQQAQSNPWPDSEWWKQFGSPTLDAMMTQAQQNNFDLKAAVARVRQADAQARISGAGLLPAIDAGADIGRQRTSGNSRASSSIGVNSRPRLVNSYSGSLNASYEIDFWGRNWGTAELAAQLAQASRFDQQTVVLTVQAAVANSYFDILATRERLSLAKSDLANAQRLLTSFKDRFEQGAATGLDVAQQESLVATQSATIPPLEQRLQQSIDALAILLGQLPQGMEKTSENLGALSKPPVTPGLPSELLIRRPDVQNAEAQLKAASADIVAARAAFFPSIGLTAGGGYESSSLAMLLKPDSMFFSLGASLLQPIFHGGQIMGGYELAQARQEELVQLYRKSVISAFADTEDALVAVKQTQLSVEAQEKAERTSGRAYKLAQEQLQGGLVDITIVLNTQRSWFAAKDALVQARLAHLQAMVGLYKAMGGGWKNGEVVAVQPVTKTPKAPETPVEAVPVIKESPATEPSEINAQGGTRL